MSRRYWAIPLVCILVLAGGLLWLLSGRVPVQEGRCTLRRRPVGNPAQNQLVGLAWQFLEPESSRPDDVRDLPRGFTQPYFYRMWANGGSLPIALDPARGDLCLDMNRDGRLSDERCFPAKSIRLTRRDERRRQFGPVCLGVDRDGAQESVAFYALRYTLDRSDPLSLYPAYYQSGRLSIHGTVYEVAVVDGDYDGRFGSVVSLPADNKWRWPRSDIFAIDSNRNGKFELSLYAHNSEVMPLGRMVLMGDRYYAIDVSPDGTQLTLTETRPTCGQLAIEPANATLRLRLWSDAADQFLPAAAGTLDLPVGTYQTVYAVLDVQDAKGDNWTFSTLRNVGGLNSFRIQPGETTRLRVGPPFVVRADVDRNRAGVVSISPVLVGCAGEEYQMDFRRNARRPPERTFKIVDEKGTVLVADQFQYG